MQEIILFVSYHPVLSIMWISLLIATLFSLLKHFTSEVKIITHGEATFLINNEGAIVVDLRNENSFCKGHIVGSINLLPIEIKANNVGKLNKYKDKPIIIVNETGIQVMDTACFLNKIGFKKIFVLKDGIFGWNEDHLPLVHNK